MKSSASNETEIRGEKVLTLSLLNDSEFKSICNGYEMKEKENKSFIDLCFTSSDSDESG